SHGSSASGARPRTSIAIEHGWIFASPSETACSNIVLNGGAFFSSRSLPNGPSAGAASWLPLTKYCSAFIDRKPVTASPLTAPTAATIAAICRRSRDPETTMMLICLAAMNDAPGVDRPPTGAPRKRVFDFLLADASPAPRRDRDECRGDEPRSDRPGRPLPADVPHGGRSRGRGPARLGARPGDRLVRVEPDLPVVLVVRVRAHRDLRPFEGEVEQRHLGGRIGRDIGDLRDRGLQPRD